MEPKDFGRVLLRRKGTVLTAVVVVLFAVLMGTMRKSPEYVASCEIRFGVVLADPSDPKSTPIDKIGSIFSQLSFLRSAEIAKRASAILAGTPYALNPGEVSGRIGDLQIKSESGGPTQNFLVTVADKPTAANKFKGERAGAVCNAIAISYIAYQKDAATQHFQKSLKQNQTNFAQTDLQIQKALNLLAVINIALTEKNKPIKELARLELERRNLEVQGDTLLATRVDYQKKIEAFRNQLVNGIEGVSEVLREAGPGFPVGADHKKDLMLGLLVGLMFGLGIALLREYLDDTVRDKESTQRELGIPVLANIPGVDGIEGFDGPSSSTIEAARTLRATLASIGVPQEKNVLLLTSTLAKSRSAVLTSLAAAFAESGRSVLVIGSDLRSGRTHESFGIANTVGLANVIRGQVPFEKAIRPAPGLDGVYVLPCGPVIGNPGELLSSEEMAFTLGRARRWADVILLDAPPVLAAADSSILGAYADGVVMVVSAGRTNRHQAIEAKEQLVAAGARVLGAVLVGSEEAAQHQSDAGFGDDIPSMMPYFGGGQSYETNAYSEWYTDDVLTTTAQLESRPRAPRRAPAKKTAASSPRQRQRVDWTDEDELPRVTKAGVRKTNSARTASRTTSGTAKKSSNGSRAKATTSRRSPSPARVEKPKARTNRSAVTAKRAPRPTPISQRGTFDWR